MKPKIDLLFLNYLEGVPSPNFGGPNHVIYDFIKYNKSQSICIDFLSYGSKINGINRDHIFESKRSTIGIKKLTEGLYYKNSFFRLLVTNDFYKPFHFFKHNLFFNRNWPNKNYQIIHSHDSVGLSFVPNSSKAKKIMTIHHHLPYSVDMSRSINNPRIRKFVFDNLRKRELSAFKVSDVLTFPSAAVRDFYFNELNLCTEKDTRIVYNGVDIDKIRQIAPIDVSKYLNRPVHGSELLILSVANHGKEKNLSLALKTIGKLVHFYKTEVLFINFGEGSQTNELKILAKQLDIEKQVIFLGHRENIEVLNLMRSSHILLHLSERVVFDLVVLEAMASGLAVFASNNGGNKEIITHCSDGYLLDSTDPQLIAKSILIYYSNSLGDNALETAKKFSLDEYARKYTNIYSELC